MEISTHTDNLLAQLGPMNLRNKTTLKHLLEAIQVLDKLDVSVEMTEGNIYAYHPGLKYRYVHEDNLDSLALKATAWLLTSLADDRKTTPEVNAMLGVELSIE